MVTSQRRITLSRHSQGLGPRLGAVEVPPSGWPAVTSSVSAFLILAIMGLRAFGVILAGYASGSKWSLFGGMREAAQVVSYEVPSIDPHDQGDDQSRYNRRDDPENRNWRDVGFGPFDRLKD